MSADDRKITSMLKASAPSMNKNTEALFKEYFPQKRHHAYLKYAFVFLAAAFIILPNVSPQLSYALQDLPIIGPLFEVTSIHHKEKNIEQKKPIIKGNKKSEKAVTYMNKSVDQWTGQAISEFKKDYGNNHIARLRLDYKVITNSEKWFTLQVSIYETYADSFNRHRYYHIDKRTGKNIKLSYLFDKSYDYKKIFSENIIKQMEEAMKKDTNKIYWLDDDITENFEHIKKNQSFYFDNEGNIVICFDKGEVAPYYMGNLQFTIKKSIFDKYLL
ncbi:MAG: RsiV family protein [Eggerthia catenaformis]|uniref:RsiV family protein n=1 Tax=Eggerthia catenaformis TaxID=31973 RepID=UPI003FA0F9E1